MARHIYVGCRTSVERRARGLGVGVWRAATPGCAWEQVQLVEGYGNPTWITLSADGRRLYAVEGDGEWLHAFAVASSGMIEPVVSRPLHGRNPVHAAQSPCGRWLLVANHLSSAVAVLALDDDGWPGELADILQLDGSPGPHRVEQPFAKPHQVIFGLAGRLVLVPDKGLDVLHAFRLETRTGRLEHHPGARLREGAGPRHAALHPVHPVVYVLGELNSTITAVRIDVATGTLTPWQVISSVPEDYPADSRAAAIAASADGRMLYATNRGHDSVVAVELDATTGRMRQRCWVPAGGRTPRFMSLEPEEAVMHVASEDDDRIVAFRRQGAGLVEIASVAETSSPTCIAYSLPLGTR
ncbi:lactonase family protein [Falsiroseomonas sp. E2-1-a20]|uniref:lactonase family protein n=1 Tax=Falsiroseomonas sp. E2-1-a20 TaxID=3239300 RepID=UPI003F2AD8B0